MRFLSFAVLVALLVAGMAVLPVIFTRQTPEERHGALALETNSGFSKIRVREKGSLRSLFFVDAKGREQCQSVVDLEDPGTLQLDYTRSLFASLLVRHPQERVLILGLGGGGMVRFLRHHFPETTVEAVEIDPVVADLARRHFGVTPDARTRIHVADAFEFVHGTPASFDAIYLDAFLRAPEESGLEEKTRRLKTREFLSTLKACLRPGGLVAFNLIAADPATGEDLSAITSVFPGAARFAVPGTGNLVVLAPAEGAVPAREELARRAAGLDDLLDLGFSLADLAGDRLD